MPLNASAWWEGLLLLRLRGALAAVQSAIGDLGGEVEAYQEVARRLGLVPEGDDSAVLDLEEHRKTRGK